MPVWNFSNNAAYNRSIDRPGLAFLTDQQRCRLERIRQARMLYSGRHHEYFVEENRTQFFFNLSAVGACKPVSEGFQEARGYGITYVPMNVLKLISLKSADLIFGSEPIIRVDNDLTDKRMKDFAERSNLHQRLSAAAVDCSWSAEAYLEVCTWRGEVYACPIPPEEIHPEGSIQPDGQYPSYVRYQRHNVGTATEPRVLQLRTRYLAGSVERALFVVDGNGELTPAELSEWPAWNGEPPPATQRTGLRYNAVVFIANHLDREQPVSDYDGLVELQDELNAKQSQVARILQLHSSPKLYIATRNADADGAINFRHEVFFGDSPEAKPEFITWNAELTAAMDDRKFTLNSLLMLAEMSPVLIGLKDGAAPDAARKLRLEATNSLAKAQRKASQFKPAIKRLLAIAQEMEAELPGGRGNIVPVGIEIRDGLPIDELDEANIVATYRSAGVMSVESGIERRLYDPAAVAKETARIRQDNAGTMPSVLTDAPTQQQEQTPP
jgi:hypothetical protein